MGEPELNQKNDTVSTDTSAEVIEIPKSKPKISETLDGIQQETLLHTGEIADLKKALNDVIMKISKPEEKKEIVADSKVMDFDATISVQIAAIQKELKQTKLELFKEKHITRYGADIITEIIVGETEDEIIASAAKSNEIYKKIMKETEEKLRLSVIAEKSKTKLPGNNVPQTEKSQLVEDNAKKISAMNADEYEKNRESILKLLKNYV